MENGRLPAGLEVALHNLDFAIKSLNMAQAEVQRQMSLINMTQLPDMSPDALRRYPASDRLVPQEVAAAMGDIINTQPFHGLWPTDLEGQMEAIHGKVMDSFEKEFHVSVKGNGYGAMRSVWSDLAGTTEASYNDLAHSLRQGDEGAIEDFTRRVVEQLAILNTNQVWPESIKPVMIDVAHQILQKLDLLGDAVAEEHVEKVLLEAYAAFTKAESEEFFRLNINIPEYRNAFIDQVIDTKCRVGIDFKVDKDS